MSVHKVSTFKCARGFSCHKIMWSRTSLKATMNLHFILLTFLSGETFSLTVGYILLHNIQYNIPSFHKLPQKPSFPSQSLAKAAGGGTFGGEMRTERLREARHSGEGGGGSTQIWRARACKPRPALIQLCLIESPTSLVPCRVQGHLGIVVSFTFSVKRKGWYDGLIAGIGMQYQSFCLFSGRIVITPHSNSTTVMSIWPD